ncbi:MAG: hypothetical protein QOD30_823 [Actinomycetota bacterium]|jgi:hypothetical protein|nr:hypothetical protein [Actinomycetota bacterium]
MTLLDEPVGDLAADRPVEPASLQREPEDAPALDEREPLPGRVLLAAGLSCAGAALVTGGIFGSWAARLLAVLASSGGVGWAALVHRSRRQSLLQALLGPVALGAGAITLVLAGKSPADLPKLVSDAVDAGRLLNPPVPFDPGWRVVLVVLFALLGYGAAWLGTNLDRKILAVALPLPVIALTAITQPDDTKFLAGLFAFVPLVAALGVLFSTGGDTGLSRQFELKRALRAAGGGLLVIVLLVAAQRVDFLFPAPAYDPSDQPQKPRSVPISRASDHVLFSVAGAPKGFTGPWRTGVLDIYDGGEWKLPGGTTERLVPIPAGGRLDPPRAGASTITLTVTTGEPGSTPIVPIVPTSSRIELPNDGFGAARWDPRTETVRLAKGRLPGNATYRIEMPAYPTGAELAAAKLSAATGDLDDQLDVPAPPRSVKNILAAAPASGWARLDYVRHELLDNVTAAGAGAPVDTPVDRVDDLLVGSKKGSPFEIVAAQVLLARWAGFPARIAFGFNGGDAAGDHLEIRPKHAAQWLEVDLGGYGWLPLLDVPPQAEASLDDLDDNKSDITASDDVSVDVLVPVEVRDPRLLFEIVRARILQALPFALLVLLAYVLAPWGARLLRTRRRTEWAHANGPRARVGVAYSELRDVATDLGVGDPFATPIEFLGRVMRDDEHTQLAWLVSRVMYGDLATRATEDDALAAEDMARSLRQRLTRAQPLQTRALGLIARASLLVPYSDEAPNVRLPQPALALRRRALRLVRPLRRGARLWARLPRIPVLARRSS